MDYLANMFKDIYSSFVKLNYYYILSVVKNHQDALEISMTVFEAYLVSNNKTIQELSQTICKKYVETHPEVLKKNLNDIDFIVPDEIYEMFSFKSYLFYNETDNCIIIYRLIYNLSFIEIAKMLKTTPEDVTLTFDRIIQKIKYAYKEKSKVQKGEFVNEN